MDDILKMILSAVDAAFIRLGRHGKITHDSVGFVFVG